MGRELPRAHAVVLAGAIVMFGVACHSSSPTPINISLKEWSIASDGGSARAGKIRFIVQNAGTEPHEFVILKTDLAPDALPVADGKVDEDKAGHVDEIEAFGAGKAETKTLNLQPGKYLFICNIVEQIPLQPVKSHYQLGMRVGFSVGP